MLALDVLKDFKYALDMLDRAEDEQLFRILCVAAASLNRSIGYALMEEQDEAVAKASKQLYKQWKADNNCIFNTFIHKYRNQVFHEAKLDLEFGIQFYVQDQALDVVEVFENDLLYVPFSEFGFGDLDIRDLFWESYKWWQEQFSILGIPTE